MFGNDFRKALAELLKASSHSGEWSLSSSINPVSEFFRGAQNFHPQAMTVFTGFDGRSIFFFNKRTVRTTAKDTNIPQRGGSILEPRGSENQT
jgi:hypothetical protein